VDADVQERAHVGGLKLDAPFYTEDELDALYETDPVAALRISREQHALRKQIEAAGGDPNAPPPTEDEARAAVEEARGILRRDGGDLEFVSLTDRVVRVRMKGACAGCPRGPLDLKNVVERRVRARIPGIRGVESVF
jgi:toxin CptA